MEAGLGSFFRGRLVSQKWQPEDEPEPSFQGNDGQVIEKQCYLVDKEPDWDSGDVGSIPGSARGLGK